MRSWIRTRPYNVYLAHAATPTFVLRHAPSFFHIHKYSWLEFEVGIDLSFSNQPKLQLTSL